jgi:chaperonin GroEL (HSP60 family)
MAEGLGSAVDALHTALSKLEKSSIQTNEGIEKLKEGVHALNKALCSPPTTLTELAMRVSLMLPSPIFTEDQSGEVVIATGFTLAKDGKLIPIEKTNANPPHQRPSW